MINRKARMLVPATISIAALCWPLAAAGSASGDGCQDALAAQRHYFDTFLAETNAGTFSFDDISALYAPTFSLVDPQGVYRPDGLSYVRALVVSLATTTENAHGTIEGSITKFQCIPARPDMVTFVENVRIVQHINGSDVATSLAETVVLRADDNGWQAVHAQMTLAG